jgi:lambda family phage tail tape measure protein
MASNNIARLGVVLGLDTSEFTAEIDKAISANQKMANAIKRDTNAAAGELKSLIHATEDYGKALSKVELIQREITSGKFMSATSEMKQRLLDQAAAYDKIAASQKKITGELTEQQKMALTYQTTDLFTQIASGQNPMIALIQQGGQLKDAMGGVGGMFRAIGTLLTPFNLALGGTVSVIGALAYATYEADKEFKQFQASLAATGNYAGMTATQLVDMSKSLASSVGTTVGAATDVLNSLVSSGKFTSTSLDSVAKAVLTYSRVARVDAQAAADALTSGLDGTAASAKSLNEKLNFLTLAEYKQIEALEKAGKKQEAAQLVAETLNKKLKAQKEILDEMEGVWAKTERAMSKYWSSLKEAIYGPSTAEGVLKKTVDEITAVEFAMSKGMSGNERKTFQERLDQLQQRKKKFEELLAAQKAAETPEGSKGGISEYDKYKEMLKAKGSELEKSRIDADFKLAEIGASEMEKLQLESARKISEAQNEMRQNNIKEDGRATAQNLEIYKNKAIAIASETAEKIRQLNSKDKIALSKAQIEEEQRLKDMNDEYAKMIATNEWATREKTRSMELAKEELQLKNEVMFATEREQRLAELKLKYDREREEAATKAGSAAIIENLNKQEAIEKFNLEIQTSMKRTQQVFDTVFGSLSAAIDNFVKTGKLSIKDLARSMTQEMIAMEMKLQAMTLLRTAFRMFLGYTPGGSVASADPSQYALNFTGARLGAKAAGGSVTNNTPYLVGERGPELFVPSGSGTIIPNGQVGGMGGTTNVTNNYINAIDTKSFEDRLLGSSNAIWAANQYAGKNLATNFGRT